MSHCPHCCEKHSEDADFCPNTGLPLSSVASRNDTYESSPNIARKVALSIGILVIIIGIYQQISSNKIYLNNSGNDTAEPTHSIIDGEEEKSSTDITSTLSTKSTAVPITTRTVSANTLLPPTIISERDVTPSPTRENKLVTSLPSRNDVFDYESLWTIVQFEDLFTPGENIYRVSIRSNDEWRWTFAWCAISSLELERILSPLTVKFYIDNLYLSNNEILQHRGVDSRGWACQYWSTILSDFPRNASVNLRINYSLSETIFDGVDSYPPGNYAQTILMGVN